MKKFLLLLLIALLLPLAVIAEGSDEFNVEGEWYVASLYTEYYSPTSLDKEGKLHVLRSDGSEYFVIHPNGEIYYNGECVDTPSLYVIDGRIRLLYKSKDNGMITGYLLISDGTDWKCYEFDVYRKYLIYDGKMLPAPQSLGEKIEYYQQGNNLFFLKDDSYEKGKITPYTDKAFACINDTDSLEQDIGNGRTIHFGYPMYFFITTDLP